MKLRISKEDDFLKQSRGLEKGTEVEVQHTSKHVGEDKKEHVSYMVEGTNGKPITVYDHEVEIISN